MSVLLAPIALTPLLKIPILLSNAFCIYNGIKPPTPIARPEERARFAKSDLLAELWTPNVMVMLAAALRTTLCSLSAVEAAALLIQEFPSPLSDQLLSVLPGLHPSRYYVTPLFLIGSALTFTGGGIRILCHRALGRFFTWQMAVQDDHKLITTGPYSIVRHPSYTGFVLLVVGKTLALLSPGSYYVENGMLDSTFGRTMAGAVVGYLAFVSFALLRRIPKEDEVLSKEFGAEWQAWAKKTPYRLIPYVY
ncbi:hypothetical protein BD414DRAFT_475638 [Trametes punicea]|nr:hypothetical protein BD414DRAFT_475638 [Trametes punicea]